MLKLAGIKDEIKDAKELLIENLNNGKAYNKFVEMVERQGGDTSYISSLDNFEEAKFIEPVYSNESGYISEIKAKEVGKIACQLGSGRIKEDDKIDYSVGIVLTKKVGDLVNNGDVLAYIHSNSLEKMQMAKENLEKTIKVCQEKVNPFSTIIKVIQ